MFPGGLHEERHKMFSLLKSRQRAEVFYRQLRISKLEILQAEIMSRVIVAKYDLGRF